AAAYRRGVWNFQSLQHAGGKRPVPDRVVGRAGRPDAQAGERVWVYHGAATTLWLDRSSVAEVFHHDQLRNAVADDEGGCVERVPARESLYVVQASGWPGDGYSSLRVCKRKDHADI